jgi:hypothetical protein
MKKVILFIFLLSCIPTLRAQDFGNEWINHSQDYFKIKIAEDGIYRLSYTYLKQEGFPVSSAKPNGVQLFYRGKEVPIYFHDNNSDQVFGLGDFIEFFGRKNDGQLDTELYDDPSSQAHTLTSFFSDTSIYMLTWNNTIVGERIKNYHNPNYSGARDSFLNYTQKLVFNEEWFDGVENADFSDCMSSNQNELLSSKTNIELLLI